MPLDDSLRRLPPAAVDFVRELLDHCWSEAAWLYGRREVLDEQGPLLSLDQWHDIEQRAEAHLVALQRGGGLVLDGCARKAKLGDSGELHTAIRLYCRHDRFDAFEALLTSLDWRNPRRAAAMADAVAWDAPDGWHERIAALLARARVPAPAVGPLAQAAGLRGWALQGVLVHLLQHRVGDVAALAEAAGRLHVGEALPLLSRLASSAEEPRVRRAAALAALQLDPRAVAAWLAKLVATEPWAALPWALAAGPEALPVLAAALERAPSKPELLLALGLLGHLDALPRLLEALGDEALAPAAADALYLLTGADLHEEAHVVDDPLDADAEPGIGLLVMRPSRSRARWAAWLEHHGLGHRLDGHGRRFRFGAPFEPARVLDELGRTTVRHELRDAMATELTIRHRLPRWYSPRMPVATQRAALSRLRAMLQDPARRGPAPGTW